MTLNIKEVKEDRKYIIENQTVTNEDIKNLLEKCNKNKNNIKAENFTKEEKRIFLDRAIENLAKFLLVVGISVGCAFMTYTTGYIQGFTGSLQITTNMGKL